MKHKIKCYEDLFSEELRIRRKIKKQEATLKEKVAVLPELVTESVLSKFLTANSGKRTSENLTSTLLRIIVDKLVASRFFNNMLSSFMNSFAKKYE